VGIPSGLGPARRLRANGTGPAGRREHLCASDRRLGGSDRWRHGDFRFLALDPGTYTLSVSQKGFATATREVIGTTNFNVDLTLTLRVAVAEETVTITAKTPVGDTKKAGTGTTLTLDELSRTPNSRVNTRRRVRFSGS